MHRRCTHALGTALIGSFEDPTEQLNRRHRHCRLRRAVHCRHGCLRQSGRRRGPRHVACVQGDAVALQRAARLPPTSMRRVRERAHTRRHTIVIKHQWERHRVGLRRWPTYDQIHLAQRHVLRQSDETSNLGQQGRSNLGQQGRRAGAERCPERIVAAACLPIAHDGAHDVAAVDGRRHGRLERCERIVHERGRKRPPSEHAMRPNGCKVTTRHTQLDGPSLGGAALGTSALSASAARVRWHGDGDGVAPPDG